jgi:hypothetical protein
MALKPLQSGIEPIGQWDLEDDDVSLVRGGEVAVLRAITFTSDGYAGDVYQSGPSVHLKLGDVATHSVIFGLVDEGTTGYGTSFGTLIGGTVGRGTGLGALSTDGAVVIGPSTLRGSGKAALWTKPGLYGVTVEAWTSAGEFNAASVNTALYGDAEDGTNDGKLTSTSSGNGVAVCLCVGRAQDISLVSTTTTMAGNVQAATDFMAVYLPGVQVAV